MGGALAVLYGISLVNVLYNKYTAPLREKELLSIIIITKQLFFLHPSCL